MITKLNIPVPVPAPIQRINFVRLMPPIVPQEQYCGIVSGREGERLACAIVHPYKTSHLYAPAFAALLPLLQAELWPSRQLADISWVDIAYLTPAGSRPQILLRNTRIESATAEIVWQDRAPSYSGSWELRAWPVIDLLERIKA